MALQLGALREALVEAGATTATANKASEEVAAYEGRLAGMEGKINVLTWMVGFNLVLTVGVLFRLFTH